MDSGTKTGLFFLISALFRTHFCAAADTLLSGQSLTPGQTLISKDGNFELGIFQPGNSQNYYIGIWYRKISVKNKTYVWVANRNAPLALDLYQSKLKLLEDGNLVLYNEPETEVWSTNTTSNAMNSSQALLGDDGNFVLRNGVRPFDVYWQSFDHLSDTWLPGGRIKYDNITKKSQLITSWRNQNDPSDGLFSLELDPNTYSLIIKRNHSQSYWSSGPWNGQIFRNMPDMRLTYIFNSSYTKNVNESYFTYDAYDPSFISRFVLDLSGQFKMLAWNPRNQHWFLYWSHPGQICEVYGFCGAYGVCSPNGLQTCTCMEGFRPQSQIDWDMRDFSTGGCVREKPLRCGVEDSFLPMPNVQFPEDQCRSACLNSCSCSAYAYNSRCSIWNGNLLQVQQLQDGEGRGTLNLRVAGSSLQSFGDLANKRKNRILLISISAGLLPVGLCIFIYKRWMNKQKGQRNTGVVVHGTSNSNRVHSDSKKAEEPDVPMFKYEILADATVNFDLANKLGEGGFGSVFKGKLPSGEEIAVKRLSQSSGQGTEEFKNEVTVISVLQHQNLVRLLGFCIKGDEKMLIYEYMPNKSLDVFIYDVLFEITFLVNITKQRPPLTTNFCSFSCTGLLNQILRERHSLGWRKCFQIIEGIARGILYLHRDSRLRVTHRDLKPSNILLDKDLNPKIADFGMARIVGGDILQANTRRVVGTYGYMSPEYALDGLFSEKSDVYSFGVLLLEIVTGMKNTGFYYHEESISLIQHVWKSWNKDKPEELFDHTISEPCFEKEMLRCIQLGLLCVQEFPKDRPNMSSIISILTSEITALPTPKQPTFTARSVTAEADSSYCSHKNCSTNNVSITTLEGR